MAIEIKGTIIKIGDVTKVSEKLSKREVIIETADNPKYPQSIPVELVNDRTSMADGLSVGDSVVAEVDVRGRAWAKPGGDTKYFLSLNVWKIERTGAAQSKPADSAPGWSAGGGSNDPIPF
jgi:hypothetical protein